MQILSLAKEAMMRYSIATSTSSAAVRYSASARINAAKCAPSKANGLSNQVALLHGAIDLNLRDPGNFDRQFDQFELPDLFIDLPILGQQLKERVWWQRSGRSGCITAPRED